jgi:hypothetical protein
MIDFALPRIISPTMVYSDRGRTMPDKPTWCGHLEEISRRLLQLPDAWVDRATLEDSLGVGRRRAQQILAPCVSRRIGSNGLADRAAVIAHLQRLAAGEAAHYERRRRVLLAERLAILDRERIERPKVLVEAPGSIMKRELDDLPEGVFVERGRITVRFETATEALEKLLALAMAIGNDRHRFESLATGSDGGA